MHDVIVPDQPEHPLGAAHEKRLLNDLKRSASNTKGRWAVRIHLSRMKPQTRPEHSLRACEHTFNTLVARHGVRFYWLRNFDFVLMFTTLNADMVRSALVKVRFLFAGDPVVADSPDALQGVSDQFMTWYRIDADYDRLFSQIQGLVADHRRPGTGAGVRRHRHAGPISQQRRGRPLTASMLAKVETALVSADLSSHVRRQSVCALVGKAIPDPLFTEVFVSIGDLREAMLPHVELAANPWLFQYLTQTLDRRVLAMLTRRDDRTLTQGFSINLNVQSILSEDFLKFDDSLSPGSHGTVVLELRSEDIFADLNAYFFARDFVHQRGYRVCIDGLTWRSLPFVEARRLGADLVKVVWQDDLPQILASAPGALAARALRLGTSGRMILARCDTDAAIRWGQDNGFTLFQGRHIDKVLRPLMLM